MADIEDFLKIENADGEFGAKKSRAAVGCAARDCGKQTIKMERNPIPNGRIALQ
ncbi:hypothetical protein [Novosphingobium sp. PhB165]|uniref:hypothetical protein n=1 Tax=Novosphingobium sp. PhB165 TaxID=2485105 RepID=UPI0014045A60|nr:hypothetical protein [Novosphingobium sp. PhB165]